MTLKSVNDADVAGKRVLMRVDFNIPEEGDTKDELRIKAVAPTIELLKQKGASKITLMTHWGRPEGKVVENLRTAPLFAKLSAMTDTSNVELLENLRFDVREESNDDGFAKELATHGDIFVNDAFAVCHRAAASTVGVTKFLPSYAGLLVEREVAELSKALTPPQGSVAIMAGAKLETKIPLLTKLAKTYSQILIGGAISNDLLKARGVNVSSVIPSEGNIMPEIVANQNIVTPDDLVVKTPEGNNVQKALADVQPTDIGFDVGANTAHAWAKLVSGAPFVLWNGPVGWYEGGYVEGTSIIAAALVSGSAHAVIGGGNTVEALSKMQFDPSKVFLSTGGGAMLEFLTEGTLVGLEPLRV